MGKLAGRNLKSLALAGVALISTATSSFGWEPTDWDKFLGKVYTVRDAGGLNTGRSRFRRGMQLGFKDYKAWDKMNFKEAEFVSMGLIKYIPEGEKVKLLKYDCPLYLCQFQGGPRKGTQTWLHERSLSCTPLFGEK